MEVNEIQPGQFVDLFSTGTGLEGQTGEVAGAPARFGSETHEVNIFEKKVEEKATEEKTEIKAEEKKEDIVPELNEDGTPKEKEVDLLGTGGEAGKPGRKPKYAFEDAVGYFEDRLKTGKFVKVSVENDKGEEVDFIPKTPEEFDEVLDIQINYRTEQAKKELEKTWYQNKPAAWQAVAKYAEMVDNPADLIPFIQGVQTIESVAQLNEQEIDGAERIVRTRLAQRGDTEDLIDDQIELLKTTNKLIDTAVKYKPLILNDEKAYLGELKRSAEAEQIQTQKIVQQIRTKAVEAIEAPIFGKMKLRNEEKAVIYDLIAVPDEQSKGYKIYNIIDNLFEKGDFETLKRIALLASKPDVFINYLAIDSKEKVAASLEKKIRVAGERGTASKLDSEEQQVRLPRNQYGNTPRFGR